MKDIRKSSENNNALHYCLGKSLEYEELNLEVTLPLCFNKLSSNKDLMLDVLENFMNNLPEDKKVSPLTKYFMEKIED